MPPELRYYQRDVLDRARARIRAGARRVLIQAAVGSGKTHVSSELTRSAVSRGRRVLFLAHRRRLIDQKGDRLREFGVPFGVLMAGDSKHARDHEAPVQVASRDTLLARAVRGGRMDLPPADVVIVDEAHNCLSDEYQALLARYPDAVHVGLTATPARSDGRDMGDFFEALECAVPTSQLVREGFLVPVRCYAPDELKKKGKRGRGLCGDPVTHWERYAAGRPTVVFAAKVEASRAVCDRFNEAGHAARHLDADTTDEERDEVVRLVEAGLVKVVCNVGVWTEGVDVPCLSCCVLLRMAGSYVLFAQAVGRVMRSHPSKTDAVLIDHAGAVLEHGFPDEDVEWSLDRSTTVDQRNKKAKEEGRRASPVACPKCGFLFSGAPACPACGSRLPTPRKPKTQAVLDSLLTEVGRGTISRDGAAQQFWDHCLAAMANTGRPVRAAAGMFCSRMGDYPEAFGLERVPPRHQSGRLVADLYPQFVRRRRAEA